METLCSRFKDIYYIESRNWSKTKALLLISSIVDPKFKILQVLEHTHKQIFGAYILEGEREAILSNLSCVNW